MQRFQGWISLFGAIGAPSQYGGTGRGAEFDELRIGTEFADVVPGFPDVGSCSAMDEACYLTIVQHMHKSGALPFEGDLNADGRVDLHDLRIWRDNRTDIFPSIANVPEPEGILLVLLGLALMPRSHQRSSG